MESEPPAMGQQLPLLRDGSNVQTKSIDNKFVKKFLKRERRTKFISEDHVDDQQLHEKGYKLRAERYKFKRELALKKRETDPSIQLKSLRDEPGYISSSSQSSSTSRSSVSFGGVHDDDLEFMID